MKKPKGAEWCFGSAVTHEPPWGACLVSVSVKLTTGRGLSVTFWLGNTVPSGRGCTEVGFLRKPEEDRAWAECQWWTWGVKRKTCQGLMTSPEACSKQISSPLGAWGSLLSGGDWVLHQWFTMWKSVECIHQMFRPQQQLWEEWCVWSLCLFSLINETVNDVTVCLLFLQNLSLIILCAGCQCRYCLLNDYVLLSFIIRYLEPKHSLETHTNTEKLPVEVHLCWMFVFKTYSSLFFIAVIWWRTRSVTLREELLMTWRSWRGCESTQTHSHTNTRYKHRESTHCDTFF